MSIQYGGELPLKRRRIKTIEPCESCGYKRAKVQITLPVGPGVTHKLCHNCDPKG